METTKIIIINNSNVRYINNGWMYFKDGIIVNYKNNKLNIQIVSEIHHVDHIRVNGTIPYCISKGKEYEYIFEDFMNYNPQKFDIEIELTDFHFYFNEK